MSDFTSEAEQLKVHLYYPNILDLLPTLTNEKLPLLAEATKNNSEHLIAINLLIAKITERYGQSLDLKVSTTLPRSLKQGRAIILSPTSNFCSEFEFSKEHFNKWRREVEKLLFREDISNLRSVIIVYVNLEETSSERHGSFVPNCVLNYKTTEWTKLDDKVNNLQLLFNKDRYNTLSWPLSPGGSIFCLHGSRENLLDMQYPHDSAYHTLDVWEEREKIKIKSWHDEGPEIIFRRMSVAYPDRAITFRNNAPIRGKQFYQKRQGRVYDTLPVDESSLSPVKLAKLNLGSQKLFVQPDALSKQHTGAPEIPGQRTDTDDDDGSDTKCIKGTHSSDATQRNASNANLVLFASNIDSEHVHITSNALNNLFDGSDTVHYTFVSLVEPRWIDNFKLRALQELHRGDAETLSYRFVFIIIYAHTDVDENSRRTIRFSNDDAISLRELISNFVNTDHLILGTPHYRALLLASPQNVNSHTMLETEKQDLGQSNAVIAFSDISQGLRGDGLLYINRLVEEMSPGTSFTTSLDKANLRVREDTDSQQIPIYSSTFEGSVQLL